jgi:hypothetical protein
MLARAPGIPTLRRGPLFEMLTLTPGKRRNDFLKNQPIGTFFRLLAVSSQLSAISFQL